MTDSLPTAKLSRFKQGIAISLISLCGLAIVLGVINGFQKTTSTAQTTAIASSSKRGKFQTLLGNSDSLLLVELTGPIYMDAPQDGGLFPSETNAVTVRKQLDEAAENKQVKGVLLRINSPGGTVAMSQELNAAVQRVSKKKPIVASLGDMAASGGYYTACAADKIVTNKGTLTASIGVIMSTMNFKNLMENKLGVHAVTIKSGKFKDLLSPYRDTTSDEVNLIQKLIDDSYQDFLTAVVTGRTRYVTNNALKISRIATIKAVADGRVVHGVEAVKVGLADEIGDLHSAYELLDKMAKERFHLKTDEKLPLENASHFPSLLEFLGLGSSDAPQNKMPKLSAGQGASYMQALPLSLRYPNQPLWVLE